MNRKCCLTGREFTVSPEEESVIRSFGLPLPDIAPPERWIRMVGMSMPFKFHRVICPVTKKPILSRWPAAGAIVGADADWYWSDDCDNREAGRPYDFNRPFFAQFLDLARRSYAPAINRISCEDSPFVNACERLKGCHLCFACRALEDCMYCVLCYDSRDLLLCSGCRDCELSYGCLDCQQLYGCRHLQDCISCRDCSWCIDCVGCARCYGCAGLRQAQDGYYLFNRKVTQAEFEKETGGSRSDSHLAERRLAQRAEDFFADKRGYSTSRGNENCSRVHHVLNSKSLCNAMYASESQDCKDVIFATHARDCYSHVWVHDAERMYMTVGGSNAYDCYFCDGPANGAARQAYSFCCYNGCTDLFGCFFLKKQSYCILNFQYSKEEYEELLPRVIAHMQASGEWGRWFPNELYGGAYRDSWSHFLIAPLKDDEIRARGLRVESDEEDRTIEAGIELPDETRAFDVKNCGKPIKCAESGRPFSINVRELEFFKRMHAPLPRLHWEAALTALQHRSASCFAG